MRGSGGGGTSGGNRTSVRRHRSGGANLYWEISQRPADDSSDDDDAEDAQGKHVDEKASCCPCLPAAGLHSRPPLLRWLPTSQPLRPLPAQTCRRFASSGGPRWTRR